MKNVSLQYVPDAFRPQFREQALSDLVTENTFDRVRESQAEQDRERFELSRKKVAA